MTFEEKPEGNGSLIDENQLDLGAKHQPNGKPGASGKAKLSARQEANAKCDLPRKSLNTYTWQEIQRHNQKTDQWLVINRKVYDVTGWADRHPGGRKVLHCYAGEDATDVFGAMHPDPDIVRLYLKPLLIGELAPEEPNQERNKNVSEVSGLRSMWRDGTRAYLQNGGITSSPNTIYPKDPDIKVGPFFVIGDLQPVKGPEEVRSPLDGCLLQPSRNIMWMCRNWRLKPLEAQALKGASIDPLGFSFKLPS
ncbi:hypothetical protein AB1E18_010923 [Capra hircus]